jgi:hypothetical protein
MAAALLAGCSARPVAAPSAAPAPAEAAPQIRVPEMELPVAEDWRDRPLTQGDWSYRSDAQGSEARFAGFVLRCDAERRQIVLGREGTSRAMRLLTTYGEHSLASGAALAATDPLLDEIAYSRGRFAVESGAGTMIVPAWPEPARVIEDCRG